MRPKTLPGTTIAFAEGQRAAEVIDSVTLGGGLVLSQVSSLTGLEGHMIQNWVRRQFVSPSACKKYSKNQFCRIALINFLRQTIQLERIMALIGHINGRPDDESDDLIDDAALYCRFVDALDALPAGGPDDRPALEKAAHAAADGFETETADGKRRLAEVLQVILALYTASRRITRAEAMMAEFLGEEGLP